MVCLGDCVWMCVSSVGLQNFDVPKLFVAYFTYQVGILFVKSENANRYENCSVFYLIFCNITLKWMRLGMSTVGQPEFSLVGHGAFSASRSVSSDVRKIRFGLRNQYHKYHSGMWLDEFLYDDSLDLLAKETQSREDG